MLNIWKTLEKALKKVPENHAWSPSLTDNDVMKPRPTKSDLVVIVALPVPTLECQQQVCSITVNCM